MNTEYIIQYENSWGDWIDCHTRRYEAIAPAIGMLQWLSSNDTVSEYRIVKRTYTDEVLTRKDA